VASSLDSIQREANGARQVLTPDGRDRKFYSEAVKTDGNTGKRYKLLVRSKTNHSVEKIKHIIKTSINPTSMKVGICAFRSLREGRVLLETKSKGERDLLHTNINDKCSQLLEANIQKLRNPRIPSHKQTTRKRITNAIN
jgi:hypothetical protein